MLTVVMKLNVLKIREGAEPPLAPPPAVGAHDLMRVAEGFILQILKKRSLGSLRFAVARTNAGQGQVG